MATVHAFIRLDPDRAPEQDAFVRSRTEVLRESGGQCWVQMDDAQVDTLVSEGLQVAVVPEPDRLQIGPAAWQAGTETPQPPAALRAAAPAADAGAFWWLRCVAPTDKDWQQALALAGAEPMQTLDAATAVWRMTGAQADAVRELPFVAALGLFHPAYVAGLDIVAGDGTPLTAEALAGLTLALPSDDPAGNLDVRAFDGLDPETLRAPLEAAGATVVGSVAHGFRLRVTPAAAAVVLSVPGLLVAHAATRAQPCNLNAGVILGTNQIRHRGVVDFTVNLDGTGEVVGVVDTGCDTGVLATLPPDLRANVRVLNGLAPPPPPVVPAPVPSDLFTFPNGALGFHGTHVIGSVCGDGTGNPAGPRPIVGMATQAAVVAQGPIPDSVRPAFDFATAQGAGLISNSWGDPPASVLQRHRYLANRAGEVDRWCWLHPDVLVLFAAGNEETDANNDGLLDNVGMRLQAVAKNALVVGATENLRSDGGQPLGYAASFAGSFAAVPGSGNAPPPFPISDNASQVALFSGRGVALTAAGGATGRVRPDVVAPGTNVLSLRSSMLPPVAGASDANTPAGVPNNAYAVLSGTSMATPLVAGNAALLRQYLRTRHGQMRRPLLLEGVPLPPAANPQPLFASRPAVALHPDGLVCAWVTPALAGDAKRIVARRVARHPSAAGAAPLDAVPVVLAADVGDHAALALATQGERSFLLYRHRDGKMRLAAFDRALQPVAGFGSAGVVTLSPDARPDDAASPALLAVDAAVPCLACVWPTAASGNTGGFFQRFRADTGAPVDASAISLLFHQSTGPQRTLTWDGSRFAFIGVQHGAGWQLQLRQIDAQGSVLGAGPVTLADQAAELREPTLVYDPRGARYLALWCDLRNAPGGELWARLLDRDGQPQGPAAAVLTLPAGARLRRPRLANHPGGGWLLAWEDDSQSGHFDVYLALLGPDGQIDARLPENADAGNRRVLRLSDTPGDTDGFALVLDSDGVVVAYQNPDEVNADLTGVYLLHLTRALAFEAQQGADTPLVKSGQWVPADLLTHTSGALTPVSATWSGACWDLLRMAPGDGAADQQQWLRLSPDGVPDTRHGPDGLRQRRIVGLVFALEVLWTGNDRRLSALASDMEGITVHLDDADGAPVAAFGTQGVASLNDPLPLQSRVTPQLGFFTQPAYTVVVAYAVTEGGPAAPVTRLRSQRLDRRGQRIAPPVTLATVDGVAPHQWFMFVNGESRAIAAYHRVSGADTQVFVRRFDVAGAADGAEHRISAEHGQAMNAAIARRPVAMDSSLREYGAVWQYRASNAGPWVIRFSRLRRDGMPMAHPPVNNSGLDTADQTVIASGADGFPAGLQALLPQLVSTGTHAPWALPAPMPANVTVPEWSPAWGLAWLGEAADGRRGLYFTLLDENGNRLRVNPPPQYPRPALPASGLGNPVPVPVVSPSTPGATVRDFRLAWNGRVFLLTWTEDEAGDIHHRATLFDRQGGQKAHGLPSAALLRALLVGSATNMAAASLPDLASGQGWGRVNLRQCLSPALPNTLQLRDDCALGPGRSVRYVFSLPPGTALLRVTLAWADPPGAALVNRLHLSVTLGGQTFRGNLWDPAPGRRHLSRPVPLPAVAADAHDDVQTFKQVVVANPAAGDVVVEVDAAVFPADPFNQLNLQPFAMVVAGTGAEVVFSQTTATIVGTPVY